VNYIFIRLLNNTLVASVLIIAVIITRILIRKAPKWISCALWGLVAIRLVFPFSIESVLSLIPSAEPIPVDIEYQTVPQIESGVPAINHVVNPVIESNFTPQVAVSFNPLQIVLFIAEILWCVGIIVLCVYAIISYIVLRKKVSAAQKVFDNVYVCDEVSSPFVLGIVRARIYLPSGLDGEVRECVLEHEKAHLKRFDHLWKPVGFIILAVYWFNPLCWVAYVLLCKDIELACDEKVTKDKDRAWKATYCQALLDCNVNRRIITACPVAFGEVSAKDRIKSVLNYKKPSFWIIIAAIVICAVVAVCFMTSPKKAVDNSSDIYLTGTEVLDSASPEYKEITSLLEKQHEIEAFMETVIDWDERNALKTWEDFETYANQAYTLEYVNNCFTPKYFGEKSSYYYNDDSGQLMRHEADGIVNDIQSNNIFRLTQSENNYVVVQEVATDSEPTYNIYVITDTENGLRIDSQVDLHEQNLSEATGIVNTETLKMRAEPFADASVISLLKKDQKVNILADNGEFYAILVQTDGETLVGYVNKKYINIDNPKNSERTDFFKLFLSSSKVM
jgi:beta-lactamase regulating signal transducer with metallopeptidase domain